MTAGSPAAPRRFGAWLTAVTIAAAALRLLALPDQPPLGDDLLAGASAVNFVERFQIGPTMWQHPRLRDLMVYLSTAALGPSKLGLVLPSLLLGVASVPITGLLARRFGGERAALLAALLVAIDPLHVDYSRQAVQEVYTGAFGAAGVLATLRYLDAHRARWVLAAGVAFGLGLASKWSVAFPLAVTAAWATWRSARDPRQPAPLRRAHVFQVVVALAFVPAAVYLASWVPWFGGGRSLADWLDLHRAMLAEATSHAGFNVADSEMPHRALRWFLWPTYYADSAFGQGGPVPIIAVTNPVTWLATLPAAAWLLRAALVHHAPERALAPALVLATWLPFAVATRPIWLHSALAVLPFALATVAAAVDDWTGTLRARSRALAAYAAAALLVATPLYLLATGLAREVPGLDDLALSFRPAASHPEAPPP